MKSLTLICLPILATLTLTQGAKVPMFIVQPAILPNVMRRKYSETNRAYSETNHMMTVHAEIETTQINLMISLHKLNSWAVNRFHGGGPSHWLSLMLPKHTPFAAEYRVKMPYTNVEAAVDRQMEEFFGVGVCVVANFAERTLHLDDGQLSAQIMFGAGYSKDLHGDSRQYAHMVSPPGVLGLMTPHRLNSDEEEFNFVKRSTPKLTSFAFWVDPNRESRGVMATNGDADRCGDLKHEFKVSRADKRHPSKQRPGVVWAVLVQETEVTIENQLTGLDEDSIDEEFTPVRVAVADSLFKFSATRSGIYLNGRLWDKIGPLFTDAGIRMSDDKHYVEDCEKLERKNLPIFRFHLKSPNKLVHTFLITPQDYILRFLPDDWKTKGRCIIYIAPTGDTQYSTFGHIFLKRFPTQFIFDPKKGKKPKVAIAERVGTC